MAKINGSVAQRSDSYSFFIDWSESVDTAKNQSTVTATAYVYCSAHTAYATNLVQKLIIDGTSFTNTVNVSLSAGLQVTLVSGTKTIAHDNNGYKSISLSAECDLPDGNGWGPSWGSASATVNLTNIPRHPVLSLESVSNIYLDSCSVNYKYVSGQFYCLQYQLNGENWIDTSGNPSFKLEGLNPNTEYTIQIRGLSQDRTLVGAASNAIKFRTKDVAHGSIINNILYFPEPLQISITNDTEAEVTATVFLNDNELKEVTLKTGSNNIEFLEEEQKEIYESFIKNATNIKIVVITDNKYEDIEINQEIIFNGKWKSIYDRKVKKKGQLWIKVNNSWKRAIIWSNENKGGTPVWKKAI